MITPNDILDIVDYTIEFPLFIAATTLEQTVECSVPEDIVLEWAKYANKLTFELAECFGIKESELELEDYIFAYYGSHQARELIEFCLTFYPNLITIR